MCNHILPFLVNFKRIKDMSELKFEVKIYNKHDDNLINVHMLSDERYDTLDEDKAMSLARNAAEWMIPEDCRFTIKKIKNA